MVFRQALSGDLDDPYTLLFGVTALVAAFRLAHPASHWARWFYGPERFAEAQERYQGSGQVE